MLALEPDIVGLLVLIVLTAALHASVGRGGASGYLAVMPLYGLPGEVMRPAALVLNVFATSLVFTRLWRAGHVDAQLFPPSTRCSWSRSADSPG